MKKENRVGEKYYFTDNTFAEIVEYNSAKNISIKFNDGTISHGITYNSFKKGKLKNYNKPHLCGVGFFGVGIYDYSKETERMYNVWIKMIKRCYDEKTRFKQPTYSDCSVVSEWHNFQNFAKWYDKNYINDFELDKDILIKGNKIYGPDTCCFVPKEINTLLTLNNINRGKCVLGVSKKRNKFVSQININGNPKDLGHFDTELEAFNVYKKAKEDIIKLKANLYKNSISKECYDSLIKWEIEITD